MNNIGHRLLLMHYFMCGQMNLWSKFTDFQQLSNKKDAHFLQVQVCLELLNSLKLPVLTKYQVGLFKFVYLYGTFRYILCTTCSFISCSDILAFCITLQSPRHLPYCYRMLVWILQTWWKLSGCVLCPLSSHCEELINCDSSWPEPRLLFSRCPFNMQVQSVLY